MARRHEQSVAHVYDERECCVHCGMYKCNVEAMAHVCKPWREAEVDVIEAQRFGLTVAEYRMGKDLESITEAIRVQRGGDLSPTT